MSRHFFNEGRPTAKWACLACRVVARRAEIVEPRCALCDGNLRFVGKDFHAPRRSDERQWRKVQALLDAGVVFNECRGGEPRLPQLLSELKPFLYERRESQDRAARQIRKQRAEAPLLARRREQQLARKRKKRVAEKKLQDDLIEREARAATSSSPASHASST